jgi:capsule polysaccharide export protein KpsC/LpsZ
MDQIADELRLDRNKPIVLALTSVVWDACLHYESNAFDSMADWIVQTIKYFESRPDLQLVVRVHPAEVTGLVPSRDKMADIIHNLCHSLPANVRVVPPDSPLSTYSLIDNANAVLIYSTKTGIEASAAGSPVIVAGEAWVRNKGFTRDAVCAKSYQRILDELPFATRLDVAVHERALRYAYHFFFQRMIKLPFMKEAPGKALMADIDDLDELGPGGYAGLDCVCDGILNGSPFVFRS